MELMWCWRCKAEMPMLDETEFAEILQIYQESIHATKEHRRQLGASLKLPSVHERFLPVRLRYEQLTGMKDCHQNAIMHHRISMYGPPCERCHKPLRTPKAKLCGACMFLVRQSQ